MADELHSMGVEVYTTESIASCAQQQKKKKKK